MPAPTHLRVEHLDTPLGLTVRRPRLSWRLPDSAHSQVAYQLRVGPWDSGRVDSDRSVLVPYSGPAMRSGERATWTVRVWTEAGPSDWSAPSWWEMGLLEADDWIARFIEPVEGTGARPATPRPAYLFRRSFTLDGPVARARIYATAHGIYELHLNGVRVGDLELTPGYTSYASTLQVQTYDVTGLMQPAENVLCAVVSDGWYRGQNGGLRLTDLYGTDVALLAQLNVTDAEGRPARIGTGRDWSCGTGPVLEADLFQGQTTDLRRAAPEWFHPGSAVQASIPVRVRDHDLSRLTSSPAPPVRRIQELRPISVTRPAPDRQIVDLGQNITGWVRLTDLGPEGTSVVLTHGEALDDDGDVTQDHLMPGPGNPDFENPEFPTMAAPFQVDRVVSAGGEGDVFEPRHTVHGFRYVRVEGHPRQLSTADVTGVVTHTDLRRTGWFECSDDRLDRLHDIVVWSLRGNVCDIPTDCPTRERAGWTGDWQVFVPAAAFLYDVAGFSAKWLHDLATEQDDTGLVLNSVPATVSVELAKRRGYGHGSAGWGDAAVIVPWEIYRAHGDSDLLARQWPSMTRWVEYAARAAREHRHPGRAERRPVPPAHERFIWDTGFHWGEWHEPGDWSPDIIARLADTDHGIVATAYLQHSASLLAKIAAVLGREDDEARYRDLATATRAAWQAEFMNPDGSLTRDTQATHVRALAFDLVPDGVRPQTAARLVELIRAAGTHVGTGFLATAQLLPVLADHGHLDVAYELLLRDTVPSWLAMIDRGATTIWEDWQGIDEHGRPHLSLNHYSKGAVIAFLHQYVGGIQLLDDAPAHRRFRIAPRPGGGLDHATAIHDSPYGRITSSWRVEGGEFVLEVGVPPGTSAEVHLPDGRVIEALPPGTSLRSAATPPPPSA